MCENIDHMLLHQRSKPDRGFQIIREDEESGPQGDQPPWAAIPFSAAPIACSRTPKCKLRPSVTPSATGRTLDVALHAQKIFKISHPFSSVWWMDSGPQTLRSASGSGPPGYSKFFLTPRGLPSLSGPPETGEDPHPSLPAIGLPSYPGVPLRGQERPLCTRKTVRSILPRPSYPLRQPDEVFEGLVRDVKSRVRRPPQVLFRQIHSSSPKGEPLGFKGVAFVGGPYRDEYGAIMIEGRPVS